MFNSKKIFGAVISSSISTAALIGFLFISSCGSDDGGDPPPSIDVDALKQSAVIDFSDPLELNLVGVTSYQTPLGTGYTFDQSADDSDCGIQSSYIGAPDLGAIWANGFSVAGWVKFTENRKFERILDLGMDLSLNIGDNIGENGAMNVTFARLDETNDIALTSWISDDFAVNKSTGRLIAEDAITNGTTAFYVGTITPSGEMAIYVNGQLVASKTDGHPVVNEARTSNFIGRSNWCYFDLDFKGSMSALWVFNKPLNAAEISALYQDGNSKL